MTIFVFQIYQTKLLNDTLTNLRGGVRPYIHSHVVRGSPPPTDRPSPANRTGPGQGQDWDKDQDRTGTRTRTGLRPGPGQGLDQD